MNQYGENMVNKMKFSLKKIILLQVTVGLLFSPLLLKAKPDAKSTLNSRSTKSKKISTYTRINKKQKKTKKLKLEIENWKDLLLTSKQLKLLKPVDRAQYFAILYQLIYKIELLQNSEKISEIKKYSQLFQLKLNLPLPLLLMPSAKASSAANQSILDQGAFVYYTKIDEIEDEEDKKIAKKLYFDIRKNTNVMKNVASNPDMVEIFGNKVKEGTSQLDQIIAKNLELNSIRKTKSLKNYDLFILNREIMTSDKNLRAQANELLESSKKYGNLMSTYENKQNELYNRYKELKRQVDEKLYKTLGLELLYEENIPAMNSKDESSTSTDKNHRVPGIGSASLPQKEPNKKNEIKRMRRSTDVDQNSKKDETADAGKINDVIPENVHHGQGMANNAGKESKVESHENKPEKIVSKLTDLSSGSSNLDTSSNESEIDITIEPPIDATLEKKENQPCLFGAWKSEFKQFADGSIMCTRPSESKDSACTTQDGKDYFRCNTFGIKVNKETPKESCILLKSDNGLADLTVRCVAANKLWISQISEKDTLTVDDNVYDSFVFDLKEKKDSFMRFQDGAHEYNIQEYCEKHTNDVVKGFQKSECTAIIELVADLKDFVDKKNKNNSDSNDTTSGTQNIDDGNQ